jgi:hypothetical protein
MYLDCTIALLEIMGTSSMLRQLVLDEIRILITVQHDHSIMLSTILDDMLARRFEALQEVDVYVKYDIRRCHREDSAPTEADIQFYTPHLNTNNEVIVRMSVMTDRCQDNDLMTCTHWSWAIRGCKPWYTNIWPRKRSVTSIKNMLWQVVNSLASLSTNHATTHVLLKISCTATTYDMRRPLPSTLDSSSASFVLILPPHFSAAAAVSSPPFIMIFSASGSIYSLISLNLSLPSSHFAMRVRVMI